MKSNALILSSLFWRPPSFKSLVAAGLTGLCLSSGSAWSQVPNPAPSNVVHLSASGFSEVPQDWLSVRLSVVREGNDAASVQSQLRMALDSAMGIARAAEAPDQQLKASSGAFGVYPRYDKNHKIASWQGSAELVLEGRDFTRIARTASQLPSLTIAGTAFSLSRETQQKLESDVQLQAIDRFKQRAGQVAKGFGFSEYTLREINISSADQGGGGVVMQRSMALQSMGDLGQPGPPLAMEPGMSQVNVTVSGSIQMK